MKTRMSASNAESMKMSAPNAESIRILASAAAFALVLFSGNGSTQAVPATPPTAAPASSPATPAAAAGPVIKSEQGKVQGLIVNDVVVFRGLPFAAPPVGELRWRAPKPPAKWSDV